jgi:uncharacterized lipoprotein YehR (DUF1307 family)
MPLIKTINIFIFTIVFVLCASSCMNTTDEVYLIPQDYNGEVVILYNQTDGILPDLENGAYVYRISEDGVLKVKSNRKKGVVNKNYYYLNANGNRQRIEYLYPGGREIKESRQQRLSFDNISQNEYENKVFVMNSVNGTFGRFNVKDIPTQYSSFIVGKPKEGNFLYDKMRQRITSIQKDF